MVGNERGTVAREFRTARAAALAGIGFSVIVAVVVWLLHAALLTGSRTPDWITDPSQRHMMSIALELIPFAGIFFLWFIGVIRTRLGDREDRLFATVFLGSGLLFVAMLFVGTAITGGLLLMFDENTPVSNDSVLLANAITTVMVGTLGIRMAAIFTLATTNLGRSTGITPIWLTTIGYATGAVLLFAPAGNIGVALMFPTWVFLFSVHLFVVSFRTASPVVTGNSGLQHHE